MGDDDGLGTEQLHVGDALRRTWQSVTRHGTTPGGRVVVVVVAVSCAASVVRQAG